MGMYILRKALLFNSSKVNLEFGVQGYSLILQINFKFWVGVNSKFFCYTNCSRNNNLQSNNCMLLAGLKNRAINKIKQRLEQVVETLDFPKLINPNSEEPQI